MDLKERLNRLSSIAPAEPPAPDGVAGLRRKLDRLLEPKKIYSKDAVIPIEQLVHGQTVSTPLGETFRVEEFFPFDYVCGEVALSEILDLPTCGAHLLSRDERLREMDLRDALFLDTETTGLSGGTGTFAFMIGLGFFRENGFLVQQIFMRDYSEEAASLSVVNELLDSFQFLVTFNGRYYDVPLLENRFILSRMPSKIREMPNFDLLYPSRKIWKGAYENCRLVTLESKLLGIERGEDIPSEWIPYVYFDYLRSGNGQKLYPVFHHNRMDILSMVALAGRIHLVYHNPSAARTRKGVEHFALGRLFYEHGQMEKAILCFETSAKRCGDDLVWDVLKWLSMALKRVGQPEKALGLWKEMSTWPYKKDPFPCVELAKYHEHRLKDCETAIAYVDQALRETEPYRTRERVLLFNRRERLIAKQARSVSSGSEI
jgi:uncharacterized protein